jgi:hypothetical protein
MNDLDILSKQIGAQIIGMYTFDISYADAENEEFRVVQASDGYYVWPSFCQPKRTSKFKFDQICRMADGFVAETEQREFSIDGWFTYNDFMDNYYNVNGSLSLDSYINKFYGHQKTGSQKRFAEKQSVLPPQVTQWLNKDMVVVGTKLYSFRRDLISPRD